ncbi:SH3 domain-containing protein [Picosynechococcus sp. PCC 7117]|uniref:SH3 domain-containing protein n=1 Tax=Picosynechococcus sp. PCC 7117 TaxID=195498 RepID=UPI0008105B10|nr:SH3 domain-containing protein [Picosynechococcus sp. PCC 7117]ANV86894.1 ligand-binding protein SH3 [Picosynechococcus sp. PCC 7117]
MNISNLFQFILGFILGVFLLAVGSVGAAYYFFNRMAAAPPKPVFSETVADPLETTPTSPQSQETEPEPTATAANNDPEATEAEAEEEEAPEPEVAETSTDSYKATVTWSNGLSLRAEPSQDSARLGGVDYNAEVTVLGMSDDQVWQQIRLANGTEAWVKAGNLQKVN